MLVTIIFIFLKASVLQLRVNRKLSRPIFSRMPYVSRVQHDFDVGIIIMLVLGYLWLTSFCSVIKVCK